MGYREDTIEGAEQPFVKEVLILRQTFLALLELPGILPLESVGTPFCHHLHEAVAMAQHQASAPGTIVDELRRPA
jgi:molecular chaperone GrpE (heat shock protein)